MKYAKKGLAVLLCLLIVLGFSVPSFAISNIEVDGITYELVQSHLEVAACDKFKSGDITILSDYNSFSVTRIQTNAFNGCTGITSVSVPASVQTVDKKSFMNCTNLKSVVFQGSNTTLGESVFEGCDNITDVTLPSNLKVIKANCFKGCTSLSNCTLPDSLTSVGEYAFMSCAALKKVSLGKNVVAIGKEAFSACSAVTEFQVDAQNTVYKSVGGVLLNKDGTTLIVYPAGRTIVNYDVPSGVETITDMAFAKAKHLMYVSLPASLKSIGAYGFSECTVLNTVVMNEGLTEIGNMAFQRCSALEAVTLPSTVTKYDNAFFNSGLKTVILSEGIETVCEKAFESCTALACVTLPDSLKEIQRGSFSGCTKLKTLSLPSNVDSIDDNAFNGIQNAITLSVYDCSPAMKYAVNNQINYTVIGEKVAPVINGANTLQWESSSGLKVSPNQYNYKWSSSDPSVIKVDENGTVTALKKGSAVIRATVEDFENTYAEITVTVTFTFWQKIIYFFRNLFGLI